jgi:hypothetical protein
VKIRRIQFEKDRRSFLNKRVKKYFIKERKNDDENDDGGNDDDDGVF